MAIDEVVFAVENNLPYAEVNRELATSPGSGLQLVILLP